ncbi:MAG: tyrosine-type recombinase/integrase [Candidatus Bathyarchaeia archaeon]
MNGAPEKLSMENQFSVNEKVIIRKGELGRPKKLTREDVLNAVAKYQTTSPYELAKLLKEKENIECSHMTIYRILKTIPQEEIDAVFKELAEEQLKPYEMELETFEQLPEMQEYIKTLRTLKLEKAYFRGLIRGIWYLCKHLKLRPKALTIEKLPMLRDLLLQVEEGKLYIGMKEISLTHAIRSWYLYQVGISKEKLNKYIASVPPNVGKYAREKIPIELREAFIIELQKYLAEKGMLKEYPIYLSLVYWLFYTGTRIKASLDVNIEDLSLIEDYGIAKVIDKGRHKLGREKWDKIIIGDLRKAIEYNLQSRGNPKQGKLFPLSKDTVRTTFNEIYKRLGVKYRSPNHIWRHTFAQELLDATGWNYDLVASILGWKDTRTLKACYGEMGDAVRLNTLKRAMGMPTEEKQKEFKFATKPIETFFLSIP